MGYLPRLPFGTSASDYSAIGTHMLAVHSMLLICLEYACGMLTACLWVIGRRDTAHWLRSSKLRSRRRGKKKTRLLLPIGRRVCILRRCTLLSMAIKQTSNRTSSDLRLCVDMSMDMCTDMCIDLCISMLLGYLERSPAGVGHRQHMLAVQQRPVLAERLPQWQS